MGSAIDKYLARHAEAEARALPPIEGGPFAHALTIPSFAEGEGLLQTLESVPRGRGGPIFLCVVLNGPEEPSPAIRESNARSLAALREAYGAPAAIGPELLLFAHPSGPLLLLDRATERPLPPRQGVGLARKLGCDLLLALRARGSLLSPWLHTTDADARLPGDYFSRASQALEVGGPRPSALLYPFEHEPFEHERGLDPIEAEAILAYEIQLRYYVLGLRHAGSPWAHQSIGSCLAIEAEAYAKVRGFPKREAAEDFHLLAKLAKLAPLRALRGAPLCLSGRPSLRVPFGTGKAVRALSEGGRPKERIRLYDPRVFALLGALEGAARELDLGLLTEDERGALGPALEQAGLPEALRRARASSPAREAQRRHLRVYLDALRTLKLVHALRDGGLPSLPLREAIARAPFTRLRGEESLEEMLATLREEEELIVRGRGR